MEWLRDNWLKVHLAISPLGTLLVTWVLVSATGNGQWWSSRSSLELTGQIIPLGGVIYGSGILVLEVSGRMPWALSAWHKDKEKWRKVGREEGLKKGREEVIRELLERGVELPPEVIRDLEERSTH